MTFRDDRQALLDRLTELEAVAAENAKLRQRVGELETENRKLRAQLRPASYAPPAKGSSPPSAPPARSHAPPQPTGKRILTLHVAGPTPGRERTETFDADVIKIGRVPSCHLMLENASVSRVHAVVERAESGFVIIDLGSDDGTLVNGNRVNKTSLAIGDEIKIGPFTLTATWLD